MLGGNCNEVDSGVSSLSAEICMAPKGKVVNVPLIADSSVRRGTGAQQGWES